MNNTHKKSLQHVSDTLKSFDTYAVYKEIINAMEEAGITNEIRSKIMVRYEKVMFEQNEKIKSSMEWVETIISDL